MRGQRLSGQAKLGGLALLLALLSSCASVNRGTRDYIFSVTGVVQDSTGRPLAGARVLLKTQGPVYQAITPVRDRAVETNDGGGFVFMYITHQYSTPYVLTVEKPGCQSWEAKAAAPPQQAHVATLACSS